MASKSTFVLSESSFWPKFPLSCFSFGAQRIMVSNGSLKHEKLSEDDFSININVDKEDSVEIKITVV